MSKIASARQEPIAIVGSGCRFPGGANSPSALWKLLESPRDVCQEIPQDRFNTKGFFHPDGARHGTTNVRHTYLLQEDVRVFDAAFFNISPNEADSIDPQQRLLLETVYEALETGGHTMEALRGSDTSVYVGTMGKQLPPFLHDFFDMPWSEKPCVDSMEGSKKEKTVRDQHDVVVADFPSAQVLTTMRRCYETSIQFQPTLQLEQTELLSRIESRTFLTGTVRA